MELAIECQKRPAGSKPNALRRSGLIPATLYGHKGAESVSLTINAKTAEILLKKASINNTIIQLTVSDLPWSGKTLIKEVQSHPWKGFVYHVSFFSVGTHDYLKVRVPIHYVGTAIGVKNSGGMLDTVLTELEVQCDPNRIPESIDVDVSNLDVGDALHVNQLPLPEGVVPASESDRVAVSVIQSTTGS